MVNEKYFPVFTVMDSRSEIQSPQSFVRIFFALWPEEATREALHAWQNELQPVCDGRVMHPQSLHATLLFIGKFPQDDLGKLQALARHIRVQSFVLHFDQARYWAHNHIVYAAPSLVPAPLQQLVRKLERSMSSHGIAYDAQFSGDYQPHVTLLRKSRWGGAPLPVMKPLDWQVNDFVLLQSLPDEAGANYRVLERFPLDGSFQG